MCVHACVRVCRGGRRWRKRQIEMKQPPPVRLIRLTFQPTTPVSLGRRQKGNLVSLQAETPWWKLSPPPAPPQRPNPHMPGDVNVMRILGLSLNKVRHFCYSLLNRLCFSWNRRALRGAPVSYGGSGPPPHLHCACGIVTGPETLGPTKTTGKSLIRVYCRTRFPVPSLSPVSLVFLPLLESETTVRDVEAPSEGSRRRSMIYQRKMSTSADKWELFNLLRLTLITSPSGEMTGKQKRFY